MAGARSTNTFSEALQRLIQDVSVLMTYPDADLEWLAQLQMQMVEKARQPIANQQAMGATTTPMGGPPMPGMPMPPMGGGGAPMPPGAMPGMMPPGAMMDPALMGGGSAMPPGGIDLNIAAAPGAGGRGAVGTDDELRRLVGQ